MKPFPNGKRKERQVPKRKVDVRMKKLYKSTQDRKLSGVLGGLSEVWNIDASLLRIIFIVLTLLMVGVPMIIVYVAAALILPDDKDVWE